MIKKFSAIVAFLMVFSAIQPAMAWGVIGHRVIAEIAQRHLNKKTKKAIAELIGKEGLAYWANWSDFVKSDTTGAWKMADPWHYVNIVGNLSKQTFTDSLPLLKSPNLYGQINTLLADMKNTNLPLQVRKNAFVFILHLVGDLHQPLHVGRAENLGGNRISVYWFEKKTNLHSLWDSDLVGFQQYGYSEYANVLDVKTRAEVEAIQQGQLSDWFYDSYSIANRVYATVSAEEKLGYKYNYMFQQTLDEQLLKGGLRLAAILNEAFK